MNAKTTVLGALVASAIVVSAAPAWACGGFFCSQVPVVQTAERVVFEVEGDVVSAYVQLQYSGNDPNFAWIIPVPEAPEISVDVGQAMFDALDSQTRPIFVQPAHGAVAAQALAPAGCAAPGGGSSFGVASGEPRINTRVVPEPDVDVWKQERVGPYDAVTLSASSSSDLNNWLGVNGYRVQPGSDQIVQGYLDDGMKLFAIKLSPETPSTTVEPIKLTYRDSRGCAAIPLKLTAIASAPNLEIVTWVFGRGRAESSNFDNVQIDPAQLLSESDYLPTMSRAVDEQASGRGFVTEYAQPTTMLTSGGDPVLGALLKKHRYVTRLRTRIDPSEMTADPEFRTLEVADDVSNEIVLGGERPATTAVLVGGLVVAMLLRRRRS